MGKTLNMVGGASGGGGGISLSSIAITTPPTKTTYQAGETFNPAGMVVTATYSNGATLVVGGYTVSPQTMTLGVTFVTVSYTEGGVTKTATQAVTVSKKTPTISVSPSSITLDADHLTATATVTTDSDGALSVSSSDTSVATASINGTTITVSSVNSTNGTATITVTQTASASYEAGSATVEVTATFSVLPSGYTELEYIGFTGTQYIDSGISAAQNYNVTGYVRFNAANLSTIYGVRDTASKTHSLVGDARANYNKWIFYGKDYAWNTADGNVNGTCFANTDYYFENDEGSNKFLLNDVDMPLTSRTAEGAANATLIIGAMKYLSNNTFEDYLVGNLGVLTFGTAAKLYPAKRNSDNVVGMYDTIRNTFYTNAGTGTFTAGPAV